jgi:hypothetical protein
MDSQRFPRGDDFSPAAAGVLETNRAVHRLESQAAGAEGIAKLGTTLADIEEALDRLSVGMLQMADGLVCGRSATGTPLDENALRPEARALCFHLRATAEALRAPRDACASSRFWTRRLLDSRSNAEGESSSTTTHPMASGRAIPGGCHSR